MAPLWYRFISPEKLLAKLSVSRYQRRIIFAETFDTVRGGMNDNEITNLVSFTDVTLREATCFRCGRIRLQRRSRCSEQLTFLAEVMKLIE